MKHKILIFLSMILLVLPFLVCAATTQTSIIEATEGINIEYTKVFNFNYNTSAEFNFHIFNASNGVQFSKNDVSCDVYFHTPTGEKQGQGNLTWVNNRLIYFMPANDTLILGEYSIMAYCNTTSIGGFVSFPFMINHGENLFENELWGLSTIIFILGVAFFFIILFFMMDKDHMALKILFLFIGFFSILLGSHIMTQFYLNSNTILGTLGILFKVLIFTTVISLFYLVFYFFYKVMMNYGGRRRNV